MTIDGSKLLNADKFGSNFFCDSEHGGELINKRRS